MSDSNNPSNSDVPRVPDVPQVPGVPEVPDVPQVPDIPRDEQGASAAPPAYNGPTPPASVPPAYGAATPPPGYDTPAMTQAPAHGDAYSSPFGAVAAKQPIFSILALVAGVIGVLGSPIVFLPIVGGILGLFIPAAAVVLGFLGKSKEPQARGFWLTGLITGFIGVGLALVSIVIWSVFFATIPNSSY
ncbi:DUF4190 domain-containing protein [Cryobacterium sp. TMT2-14]|uniref:DUF4190 domain-containing protein n=1 Tax=Cryobacterium sp. TMT2-14 TaxID=1259245 RepID=UPI00106AE60F|nr:DUF4190 domain-containing protein [Cryobacterium sp. TMT2-14]TFC32590.1 hypothetical protein E3O28_16040 [Cryobacterium sp. TMT2-14]